MRKKAIFIDGGAYIYRFFHGIPMQTSPSGTPINMVKGVTTALKRLLVDFPTDYICVVFDSHARDTWRHQEYPPYKAMRPEMPEELNLQRPILREFLDAMGIPWIECTEEEGDDYMATMAWIAEEEGCDVIIASPDKDMCQVVNENIKIYNLRQHRTLQGPEEVKERMRVYPDQVAELLGLIGDDIDGVPGVRGIGPVTASKLLATHGGLANLLANIDTIPGWEASLIREQKEIVEISWRLTKLYPVKDPIDYKICVKQPENVPLLIELTRTYGLDEWNDYLTFQYAF